MLDDGHIEKFVNTCDQVIESHASQIQQDDDELTLLKNRLKDAEDLLQCIKANIASKKRKIVDDCINKYFNNEGDLNLYFHFYCIYFNYFY